MRIAVVGAGSVGIAIAREFIAHGHDVTLIDSSPDAIHISDVPQADWALADACSPAALEDAAVRECDSLVAATGDDKVNLVVSLLAKTEFAVPKVVARINDPGNEWMFNSNWGVDIPASTPRVMAALVEESISTGRAVQLLSLSNQTVLCFALTVPDNSVQIEVNPAEIDWPQELVITTLIRGGKPLDVSRVSGIRPGDELLITCARQDAPLVSELEALFAPS
ncbi:TrkA family potassium uptake protein [Scrofimicrobium sp. R131]|uniref:Trk system potassium uptake protein TrkA n=1 Tax=Scrofimicrobium appendicitidis TaxID=3079930 RepID=A0AAU7VBV6_9ACTO